MSVNWCRTGAAQGPRHDWPLVVATAEGDDLLARWGKTWKIQSFFYFALFHVTWCVREAFVRRVGFFFLFSIYVRYWTTVWLDCRGFTIRPCLSTNKITLGQVQRRFTAAAAVATWQGAWGGNERIMWEEKIKLSSDLWWFYVGLMITVFGVVILLDGHISRGLMNSCDGNHCI